MALSGAEKARLWRQKNKERANEISRKYDAKRRASPDYKSRASVSISRRRAEGDEKFVAYTLWRNTKQRAAKSGIPFDLDPGDVVIPKTCPVFGTPIVLTPVRSKDGPSIDKTIPSLGYVKGNVAVISMKANRLKSNGTIEEFEAILAYLRGIETTCKR